MEIIGIVPALRDGPLRDRDGLLLGRVEDLLFDAQTNRPAWLVVRLSDGDAPRRTLVPARGSRTTTDGLQLAHTADAVRACPVTLSGPAPLREHVLGACRHYGIRRFARRESFTSAAPALGAARVA
jgi:PRC-barrel domain protein